MRVQVSLRALRSSESISEDVLHTVAGESKGTKMGLVPFVVLKEPFAMRSQRHTLTPRIRVSTKIAALYALGRREEAAKSLRNAITRYRLPRAFFSELFLHLSLFLGYPAMLDAFEDLDKISPAGKNSQPSRVDRKTFAHRGLRIFHRIYGSQVPRILKRLKDLHPELPYRIVEDAYGRIFSRSGLSLQERELVIVVLLATGGYQRRLFSHFRGALRIGVPERTVRDVLANNERLTGKTMHPAMSMIDALDDESQQTEQSL